MAWPFAGASRRSRRGSDTMDPFPERGAGGGQRGANYVPVYTSSLDEVSPLLSRDGNLMRPQGITLDDDVRGGAPNETIDDWEADKLEKQKHNLSVLEAEVEELRQELKQREEKGFDVSKLQADLQLMADEVEKERRYLRSQSKAANSCGAKLKSGAERYRNMGYYTLLLAANCLLVWWIWSSYHGHDSSSELSPTAAPTTSSDRGGHSSTDSSLYSPTPAPTIYAPTSAPTDAPTDAPTFEPTYGPSIAPTHKPTQKPTAAPVYSPTALVDGMTPAEIADGDPMAGVKGITDDYIHDGQDVPETPEATDDAAASSETETAAPYDPEPSTTNSKDDSKSKSSVSEIGGDSGKDGDRGGASGIGGDGGKDGDRSENARSANGEEEVGEEETEEVQKAADVEDAEEDEESTDSETVSNWADAQHSLNNDDGGVKAAEEEDVEEEQEEADYDDMEGNEVEGPSSWADVQRTQNEGTRLR